MTKPALVASQAVDGEHVFTLSAPAARDCADATKPKKSKVDINLSRQMYHPQKSKSYTQGNRVGVIQLHHKFREIHTHHTASLTHTSQKSTSTPLPAHLPILNMQQKSIQGISLTHAHAVPTATNTVGTCQDSIPIRHTQTHTQSMPIHTQAIPPWSSQSPQDDGQTAAWQNMFTSPAQPMLDLLQMGGALI